LPKSKKTHASGELIMNEKCERCDKPAEHMLFERYFCNQHFLQWAVEFDFHDEMERIRKRNERSNKIT